MRVRYRYEEKSLTRLNEHKKTDSRQEIRFRSGIYNGLLPEKITGKIPVSPVADDTNNDAFGEFFCQPDGC